MKPQHALQLSLQRRVIPVFLPNSVVFQLKIAKRSRHLQLAIHIKLERPRRGDARRSRRYRGNRPTCGRTQRRSEDRTEPRSGFLLDYPSHTPLSPTGCDPPACLPNALLVVDGVVNHRQFGEPAVADEKGSKSHALPPRVLGVAEVRNKQFVVAQITQCARAPADETRVHAHKLALKAHLQLLDDREKELSIREWEKRWPLAIEGFVVALLEDGEKVLLAPIGTMASVVSIKSVGSSISTTPTWRTRLGLCPSGSSSKIARCDARGTQLHHVTSGGMGLTANNPRWYTTPFDPRSPPSCSTTHSPSDFPL